MVSYLLDPEAWIQQNYGEGYSNEGVKTVGSNGGVTITHNKRTPETHPWLFIDPTQADVNGRIYDTGPVQSGTGISAGRQASDAERQASYASNNYYKNGGKGLDPALMRGMTRYITPGQTPGNTYRNQYGQYTQQHARYDDARARAGLDPWVREASRFSGKDQQGNALNYINARSGQWGDSTTGGASFPGVGSTGVQGPNYAGLPSGFSQLFGGPNTGATPPQTGGAGVGSGGGQPPVKGGGNQQHATSYIGMPGQFQVGGAQKTQQPWFHVAGTPTAQQQATLAAILRAT